MSVYLITGVSGYLGQKILGALTNRAGVDRIIGIDIAEPKNSPSILDFRKMDVRDPSIRELMVREKVEVVIHLAFVLNPIRNLVKMHSIDYWGTDNILRATAACKAKQLFVTSSASAYGAFPDNPEPLFEHHPLRAPRSYQYAYDKAQIDQLCQTFMSEHPAVAATVVRPCIVLGPNVDNYISRGLTMGLRFFIGGGDPKMQFVHEDDVAAACIACIERKANGIYNLVGEGILKMSEMWDIVGGLTPPINFPKWFIYPAIEAAWQLNIGKIEAPSGQLDFMQWPWWCSGEKMEKEVNFKARYSSIDALKAFVAANAKR